jgi:hypothetical protein
MKTVGIFVLLGFLLSRPFDFHNGRLDFFRSEKLAAGSFAYDFVEFYCASNLITAGVTLGRFAEEIILFLGLFNRFCFVN